MRMTGRELQNQFNRGENISSLLRTTSGLDHNSEESIEISYDLQAGSYIQNMTEVVYAENKKKYCQEIAHKIAQLDNPRTILEAGVGEGTTLSGVIHGLNLNHSTAIYGFDISWSRIAYAQKWLKQEEVRNISLCTGSLLDIPFRDDSIDVVYTAHTIEPNHGKEEQILKELFRVTRNYLILVEPAYELASDAAKKRMEKYGYCRGLLDTCELLGYHVTEHKLCEYNANPLNPAAITVIKKMSKKPEPTGYIFACPKYKTPLHKLGDLWFSPEALVAYPTVAGIPCLRIKNGIVASKLPEFI